MQDGPWYQDRDTLAGEIERHGSVSEAARAHGTPTPTVGNWARKYGLRSSHKNSPGAAPVPPDDETIVTLPAHPKRAGSRTPEQVLTDHGLDPDEWTVTSYNDNFWEQGGDDGGTLTQSKVTARRRKPLDCVLPARGDGWIPPKPRRYTKPETRPRVIALFSDGHAPYQDRALEDCANQWLADVQPYAWWDLGDLLDLPTPSRHRTTRGFEASPQEGIDERYKMDARRVAASPKSIRRAIVGNHDVRIEHAIVDKIGRHVAGISRAGESTPAIDLGYLLRYDELGIELVRPDGDYHSVTVEIAPGLHARHGTKAGVHGGAVKAIAARDSSLAQGHAHKLAMMTHVRYDADRKARTIWSLQVPAMCQRDLGYMEDPNTAQGFLTVTLHQDGSWHPEHAVFDEATGRLMWRDRVYTAA
jgi:hypothetical protein